MNRVILLVCACASISLTATAQSAEDSVKAVITRMFAAMKSGDRAVLQTVFADSAQLQSIARSPEGKTIVRNESVRDFIEHIGKLTTGAVDERIKFESVKVEGSLASVWTPYTFYFNGQFSHCGVNSFQMVRMDNTWKVQYIIDTRRKEGCVTD